MGIVYLLSLIVVIGCMLLLDFRFRLFFWRDPKSASIVTIVGVLVLLIWDFAGIALNIFIRGEGNIATGILLAPELPIEEPIFLTFLVLCTMIIYTGLERIYKQRIARRSS